VCWSQVGENCNKFVSLRWSILSQEIFISQGTGKREKGGIKAGWPDWANFRLLGDCFLSEVSPFFCYSFRGKSVDKKRVGLNFGRFWPGRHGAVDIASASVTRRPGFESSQVIRFFRET
jgi:hypothetical protein